MKKSLLHLFIVLGFSHIMQGQVSAYNFTQTTGTYAPISGTDLFGNTWDDNESSAINIGFNFNFNGLNYSSVYVLSNGFLAFDLPPGSFASVEYAPISSTISYSGAVSGFGNDLLPDGNTSSITYTTTGTAPNRQFIVQWLNAQRYAMVGDVVNFQIVLNETSNRIDVIYGACSTSETADGNTNQIGLRGAASNDFNNLYGGNNTPWTALTAGASNVANVNFKSTILPPAGLTFSWVLPPCFTPVQIAATGITSSQATFSWTSSVISYDLYYGTTPLTVPNAGTVPTATTTSTSYTANGLAASTLYQLYIRANCGGGDLSTWSPVTTFMTACQAPAITAIQSATRCGIGTLTLGATSSGNLNWFTAATGGSPIASGPTFTTPTISSTTNYYVSASTNPYSSSGGVITPIPTSTTSMIPFGEGLYFDAIQTFTLNSVDVYPDGPSDGLYVDLYDSNNNQIASYYGTMPAGNGTTPFTVPLNVVIPVGTGYFFEVYTDFGTSLISNPSGVTYPYPISSVGKITSGSDDPGQYYYLYNFQISSICEGPRSIVTASVTAPPALSVSSGTTVCANVISPLSITSTPSNFNGYTWLPVTNLYTDAAATVPYSGGSATLLYYKSAVASTTTYSVLGTNSTSGCANLTVTNMGTDVPVIVPASNPPMICSGNTATLVARSVSQGTSAVGTNTTTTNRQGITPYSIRYEGSREQYLIRASELQAANIYPGNLTSVAFSVTAQGAGTMSQNNFTIKLAHTANTALNSAYGIPTTGFTTVYGPATQALPSIGLNQYTFSTPFYWDGVSNILVDICHDNDPTGTCTDCYSSNSRVMYTATPFNSVWGSFSDNAPSCGVQAANTVISYVERPNMIFGGQTLNASGAGINWSWNPGAATTNTMTVSMTNTGPAPNSYSYTVMALHPATTCTNSAVVSLSVNPAPSITVSPSSSTVCAGTSTSLTASGATSYTWLPTGGSSSVAVVNPVATTVYTVTGTSLSCSDTRTLSLSVIPSPTVTASISSTLICAGTTVSLTASGANTYTWMPNSSTSGTTTAAPTASTIYTVSGTSGNCTNTRTLSVTVNQAPTLTLSANPAGGALCSAGATGTLTAIGTSTAYAWSTGATTSAIVVSPTITTTYTVSGTNSCGTGTAITTITVATTPTITATTSSTLICINNSVVLSASATPGVTYAWNTGASTSSVAVTPTVTTTYTVTGTNACGTATATIVQNVSNCTGITDITNAGGISIYPNPANDYVNIAIPADLATASTVVEVSDALGKLVMKETLSHDVNTFAIMKLQGGVYFFKVISNNQTLKIGKVVKQ